MNRRELFLSSAKATLTGALGGPGLSGGARAQPVVARGAAQTSLAGRIYSLIGKVAGTPGSPAATLNIPGDQSPPPPCGGTIELNAAQSQAYWPVRNGPRRRLRRAQLICRISMSNFSSE